jgi:NDP-sugar pyrophosphorylase family protein
VLALGPHTSVGTGAVVFAGASVGADAILGDQSFVRERTVIGERSVVGRGSVVDNDVQIGARMRIQTGAYLTLAGSHATEGFAAAVERAIGTARRHGALLQLVSLRVMAALAEAELRCTQLKGPLLGEAILKSWTFIQRDAGRQASAQSQALSVPCAP